jgi:hypothetical protein
MVLGKSLRFLIRQSITDKMNTWLEVTAGVTTELNVIFKEIFPRSA